MQGDIFPNAHRSREVLINLAGSNADSFEPRVTRLHDWHYAHRRDHDHRSKSLSRHGRSF
jgi:hypothetical protein